MFSEQRDRDIERLLVEASHVPSPRKEFVADLHARILQQMDTAPPTGKPSAHRSSKNQRRRTVRARRIAAALLIAVGAVSLVAHFVDSNVGHSIAFAQVQDAVRRMKTATITFTFPNQPERNQTLYLLDTHQFRREHPNGLAFVYDPKQKKIMGLNPDDKTAWFMPEPKSLESSVTPWGLVDRILKVEQAAVEPLGRRVFNGKTLIGFRLGPLKQPTVAPTDMRWEAWVDPETRLPVRVEETPLDPDNPLTAHRHAIIELTFDLPIEKSRFSMTPPDGYRLTDSGPFFPLPAAPKDKRAADPIITPGVGIDEARFGMKVKQVIERLGQPSTIQYLYKTPQGDHIHNMKQDSEPDAYCLNYKSRGFTLHVAPQAGLKTITTHDGIPALLGFRAFSGRTQEGIALGATRADVEKAYGVPERIRGPWDDGTMAMLYPSKRLFFGLKDGRVNAIQSKMPGASSRQSRP